MEQSVSLYPALLGFLSLGAVLMLQKPGHHPSRKLWLVSASEAYETNAFSEFNRLKREIGEGIKSFFLLDEESGSSQYYRIELPSGQRELVMKEWVDSALKKRVLLEFDPEIQRKQRARIHSEQRTRQIRSRGWSMAVTRLVIDGKIAVGMSQAQVMTSWGKPDQITRLSGDWGVCERWVYGSTVLYFGQNSLHSYEERGTVPTGPDA
jgi:hypothetical protein